jgi:hypothetical protein
LRKDCDIVTRPPGAIAMLGRQLAQFARARGVTKMWRRLAPADLGQP